MKTSDTVRAQQARWRAKNRLRLLAERRALMKAETPEQRARRLEAKKRYREANAAKIAAYKREWRKLNVKRILAYQSRYWKARRAADKAAGRPPTPYVDLKFNDQLYASIHALVPRGIVKHSRDDMITDIYIGVLEGNILTPAYAKQVINAYYRNNTVLGTLSLDARRGGQSLGERIGVY